MAVAKKGARLYYRHELSRFFLYMSLNSTPSCRAVFVAATLVAAACARPVASRSAMTTIPDPVPTAGMAPAELLLDTELSFEGCTQRDGGQGFARMKVRDSYEAGAPSELEYELAIENKDRRPLSEAVLALSGVGSDAGEVVLVLWNGEVSTKPRLRMRGIIALPRGVSTSEVAAALRERRGALQVRVEDQTGAVAGCGDLRN